MMLGAEQRANELLGRGDHCLWGLGIWCWAMDCVLRWWAKLLVVVH